MLEIGSQNLGQKMLQGCLETAELTSLQFPPSRQAKRPLLKGTRLNSWEDTQPGPTTGAHFGLPACHTAEPWKVCVPSPRHLILGEAPKLPHQHF